jgi:hypothetical protein
MGKIPGWTPVEAPNGFIHAWEHEDTGDMLAVTEKVPNDGYYVMGFNAGDVVRHGEGSRYRFDASRRVARKLAADVMRGHGAGLQ